MKIALVENYHNSDKTVAAALMLPKIKNNYGIFLTQHFLYINLFLIRILRMF
jgi:hypothetical protein